MAIRKYSGVILMLLPVLAGAEATKEFYSDQNPADARLLPEAPNVFTWGIPQAVVDLNFKNEPAEPEGLNVSTATKTGAALGGWGIFTAGNQNYSAYSGGALRFWAKGATAFTLIVEIESAGGQKRNRTVALTTEWQEFIIPFTDFSVNAGFSFSQVTGVILMTAPPGNFSWVVDHVRWTKPVTSLVVFPSTVTLQENKHRQFTVEGRDAAGERVVVYSTFTATVGTIVPSAPLRVTASTFTAGATPGVVTARLAGLTVSPAVSIVAPLINEQLGLLSETIPTAISLDVDSKLFAISGGGGTDPTLLDESSGDVREGVRRFKTTIQPQGDAAFSGWYIQWDTDPDDAITRNMSRYYDGAIRFWFKGPAALQNNLEVGVRSGNVTPGAELSKVLLKNYVTFDDTWRSVVIPLKDLAGARPWADISRTKILFSIFASFAVGSEQSFYIDNLRWDTNIPGVLTTMNIQPNPVTVPLSSIRQFTVRGLDANGVTVDVFPTWSVTGGIGSVLPTQGERTLLTAGGAPVSGTIVATLGAVSASAVVNVADVTWTQSFNVYSDAGSGGMVGVAVGAHAGTTMSLSEQVGGVASDPLTFRRANFTLVNNSGLQDAFAIWFTNFDGGNGSRFMRYFENGYLSFWVKTSNDLQFAVRSANIAPGAERSKIRLSELGIPTNSTWQRVVIPLADLKTREPLLDFDQIQTYFAIGGVSAQIGPVVGQVYDVDEVKWLTNDPGAPDPAKVYIGLKEKQAVGGLVRSYDTLPYAVTYDQALAAMAFTYHKDTLSHAKKIFDVYKYIHDNYTQPAGAFNGFHDEYNISSSVGGYTVLNSSRTAGPNAWMLLALIHYKNVQGGTDYDAMMANIAAWLRGLQAADDAIQFGRVNATLLSNKSTEHNFDCYAAFRAYAITAVDPTYNTTADEVLGWLQSSMYVPAQQRFNVGETAGGAANTDRALDAYSWAPLALSSYTNVLATADADFKNSKVCDLTGINVTGFDFSGLPTLAVDKDAVWLEGTAHMALAYYYSENPVAGDFYVQELDKAIVNTSLNGQGLAYATNNGTAYGFNMNSLNPAASSAAWYLFAKKKFNPFQPHAVGALDLFDIAGSMVKRSSMTWTVNLPARWVRANQMLRLTAQPISTDPWGVQIYTDNTNAAFVPRFVDPTPGDVNNHDSNPAGLLREISGQTTSQYQLNLAWSIKDSSAAALAPLAESPAAGTPTSFQWLFMKDRATPDIPSLNILAFADGQDDVTLKKTTGAHMAQGEAGYFLTSGPDYVYMQGDFTPAAAQRVYSTKIIVEFFLQ